MEMRAIYAQCMAELMTKDRHVCILDADLSKASGTRKLYEQFPNQMFDCGVQEANMASTAAGLASYGFKPWIESFAPFASRRICDQAAISIAYAGMNVKIVGTDPGVSAEVNGGTHMGMMDIAVLRSIPGIVIFEPVDGVQLRAAIPVINDYEGITYIRMFRKELPDIFDENYKFDLFKADLLKEGSDVTILATGFSLKDALEAAKSLEEEGISAEVINVHTIKPIDRETVMASAKKTGCIVTVENHNVMGGLYSAVCEAISEDPVPVTCIGFKDRFGEVGKLDYLKKVIGLTAEDISFQAKRAIELKKG